VDLFAVHLVRYVAEVAQGGSTPSQTAVISADVAEGAIAMREDVLVQRRSSVESSVLSSPP
jgi:hypothetical protein